VDLALVLTMPEGKTWEPYDPAWLVDLARQQYPDEPWLAAALARCTRCMRYDDTYVHFVSPERANQPGADWQHDACLELESPTEGWVVLDILKDGEVGGVEFVAFICP
jgi:hypothetical protein